MKKHWIIYFLCSTLFANAAPSNSSNSSVPCAKPVKSCSEPAKSCPKPVPYDADLFRRDVPVYSAHGSFLFWRIQEGALDYALKMGQSSPSSTNYAIGEMKKATYHGAPGFRVALSYFRAPNYWEIWWQYTRLTAHGSNRTTPPSSGERFITATWPVGGIAEPLSGAHSDTHFNYNVGDFLVDRFFNPNPHLRLRLVGGGSVAWMNQSWDILYTNSVNQESRIHNHWKFVGGGLKIGTTVDWYCGWDIYLTAQATAGSFLGSYHNTARQTSSLYTTPIRNMHFSDVRPAFTIQGIFGPSWQKNFCSMRAEIFAGYEINTWFNLQETYRSSDGLPEQSKQTWLSNAALALQGLTTRLTLDF